MSLNLANLPILLVAFGAAIGLGGLIYSRPRLGMAAWLVVIAFVPIWMGVTIKLYFMPVTLVGIVALLAVLPRLLGDDPAARLGLPDFIVAALFVSCLIPIVTGGSTRATVFVVLTNWLIPFIVGRMFPRLVGVDWIYRVVAVIFALVGIGLLIEFLTNYNPFVTLLARGNPLYTTWGTIQTRGDQSRAEWAFGHSIAAGSSVALAMPLTIAARLPTWLRMLMVLIMGAGVVVTLSRVSMIGAVLGVLMMAVLMRDLAPKIRAAVIVGVCALVAALGPFVSSTLADAGSEAANSASYRGWLVALVPHIAPLGFSPVGVRGTDGTLYFGNFQSIDSELIYLGLLYGWFALVIGLVGLLVTVGTVVARRATPATIALAAQIPTLATVAFITQYTDFFWFAVGLAAYTQASLRARKPQVLPVSNALRPQESLQIISRQPSYRPSGRVN
ncbi:hypothetical protein GCM10011575_17400 [Microlunatus endophyticus]|uniref:O-antigen ligase like membrane protein n=2 Tax=Microlunatus endophyticus TaxID=1716077 RepID=A0A917S5E4_9ACTN|nr:hypothetical protein GCM10011575_17400 [Microlunatus endophyticus]